MNMKSEKAMDLDAYQEKIAGVSRYQLLIVTTICCIQEWKLKPKPKPENPVLKEILETQTEIDTCLTKILKT